MKDKLLAKIFNSKWNYAWGRVDEHLIALFYKKGGFAGLYDYVVAEKERMDKDKSFGFSNYYSGDLIDNLQKAKVELNDFDFENYIFNSGAVVFNQVNFKKLSEYGLLKYYYDFGGTFRGNIIANHKISHYSIIETIAVNSEKHFYVEGKFTECYETLETALVSAIFQGKFYDTLQTLLKSVDL